jgi:PilZ domain
MGSDSIHQRDKSMGPEKRKYLRRDIDRDVQIKLADGLAVRAILLDISQGGARLKMKHSENLPDQFILKLSGRVHRWCRIAWRTAEKVGLEFISAPQATANLSNRKPVLIRCPHTGKMLATGIRLRATDDLKRILSNRRYSQCPYCNIAHGWTPSDAFVENFDEQIADR